MRLRSSELSNTKEAKSDSCLKNRDAIDEKELSLNCGSEPLLDGIVEKRVNDAEHIGDVDDILVPLGSKVLVSMDNVIASCPEREILCVPVECVTVGVKEGKESASVNLNVFDSGLKEEFKSSPLVSSDTCQLKVSAPMSPLNEVMECKDLSENIESVCIVDNDDDVKIISGGEDSKTSSVALNNFLYDGENAVAGRCWLEKKVVGNLKTNETSSDADVPKERMEAEEMMVSLRVECQKEAEDALNAIDEKLEKRKRGRKRKNLASSESNGDVKPKKEKVEQGGGEVSGRVLRSRTMDGSVKVVDSGLSESVVGFKRKMEAECLGQTELQIEVYESTQLTGRPQKKQKRRGRPPKVQGEAGFKRKMKTECSEQTVLREEVNESIPLIGKLQTKQKRRGRPAKARGEEPVLQETNKNENKDTVIKNVKSHGRPAKLQTGKLSKRLTLAKKPNCMVGKKNNNLLMAKDVKEGPKIHNGQKDVDEQLKSSVGGADRRKKQQLVRDQIVSMIMKAGWTIEYRPRQQRDYLDAVYVDQKGRTHWSITKAYRSLKKRIDDGDADYKEVCAFTVIPDEEMSVLCKLITKVRSDKNKKKNRGKDVSKAEIVISGEAQPKKKPGKKSKDGTKRKEIHNSAVKLAGKSSGVKVRGDIAGSSFQGRPKISQKGRPSRKPRLVARSSREGLDQGNDGCTIYSRKRNLLSWMIDSGVIMPGGKVQYGEGRRRSGLFEGIVTCDGIQCSCCNKVIDISSFVSHGGGKLTEALKNMHFQSGSSLLKCLLESWRKEEESSNIRFNYVDVDGDDPNDDTCNICGDGGNLICCDGCPSTFHQSCLDIQNFPSGDWHCIYCSCKFCGLVVGGASEMNDSHHVPDSEMLSCCLCEEKFHPLCLQEEDDVNIDFSDQSFCGRKCQEIYEQLQTCLGVTFELKEGFSWTLLQRSDVGQNFTHLDAPLKVECNSKLALAFSVMDECFEPIMDERSGVNTIHNVVYNCGSNFRRLNYSGFFTAILQRGDEFISVASIRIHGHRLAEMPFIGTRHMYRRQGMCRRLLDAIEGALGSLGVGELIIPAIPELFETWTKVFGFEPLEASKRQTMKCMSMMVFPGTDMLLKPLLKNQFADKNLSPAANDKAAEQDLVHLGGKSSNAIDYEQRPALMEEATHLESDTPTTSCQVPEATATSSSDTESEIPLQHVPSDPVVRSSDDSAHDYKVVALVKSKQLPSTKAFQDSGLQEPQSGVENDGLVGVKTSPLASTVVPKNTFDLNLQPAVTDTDTQTIDDNSLLGDTQACKNSFGISDSSDQVDNDAVGLHDSKTCAAQPLVLV